MSPRSTIRPAQRTQRVRHRTRAVFLLTIAALAIPVGASALAATSYSVKLKLPSLVQGARFKVTASGTSARSANVTVFLSTKSCAASSKAEANHSARRVINKSVRNSYVASKTVSAGASGSYRACAYVTTGSTTRAHASKGYSVLTGGY